MCSTLLPMVGSHLARALLNTPCSFNRPVFSTLSFPQVFINIKSDTRRCNPEPRISMYNSDSDSKSNHGLVLWTFIYDTNKTSVVACNDI